ncbi:hypothetical protein ACFQXA_16590 [Nocardiopsis composta]
MPSAPAVFVDREHDLEEIGRLLERTTGTCVLLCEGPRGVGKSALLLRAADEFAGRFPDGRLYYDYSRGDGARRADPDAALTEFLIMLGVREEFLPTTYEGRLAEYRNRTADAAVLVIVEGAEEPAQVRQLVPAGPRSALLACGDGPALAELSIEPGERFRCRWIPCPTSTPGNCCTPSAPGWTAARTARRWTGWSLPARACRWRWSWWPAGSAATGVQASPPSPTSSPTRSAGSPRSG